MKLALIFLSIFLVVSCSQQRQDKRLPWPLMMPMYYSPRALYQWQNPYFLDAETGLDNFNPSPALDWEGADQTLFQPEEESAKISQDATNSKVLASIESRSANRFRPNSFNLGQQRLFFGAFNPFANTNTINWLSSFLQSSTLVTVTVPSTLVTAVISTCIPAGQFIAGSTNNICARRRRQVVVDDISDQLEDGQVSPTLVQKVEPTAIPAASIRDRRQTDFQQRVISSKDDIDSMDADSKSQLMILQRQNRALTVTFTTTSTNYIFSSTVVKKTLNLAINLGLSCLPAGFLVC